MSEPPVPPRILVVWCPDWPVVAAAGEGAIPADVPVAVLAGGTVLACSQPARAEGVRRGLRKREAQARCAALVLVEHDPARDFRAFEPVVEAVEALAPGVEVTRPGMCAVAARGPAGYFGGEAPAAERIVEHVAQTCAVECQVGIADGAFAAGLAARMGSTVPAGRSVDFLADLDIAAVDLPELTQVLRRLGIRTVGAFAAIPPRDVLTRFGFDAAIAHRLARGLDERLLDVRRPPPDLVVTTTLDPPVERMDAAAFVARGMAERLHELLAAHGLATTRLLIEARTGHGEELARVWRHDGILGAGDIADRVRWQLDGWLTNRPSDRPTAGIVRLRLVPEGVIEHGGLQLGLWGDAGEGRDRANRAIARVQGLLGPEAVVAAVPGGGRGPADRVRFVPWGFERVPLRPAAPPWPGQLTRPAPAVVPPRPLPAAVYGPDGTLVGVTGRHQVTAPPTSLVPGGAAAPVGITAWAGPWPVEERWWVPGEVRRRARFQVTVSDGRAFLLALEAGRWWVEGIYD